MANTGSDELAEVQRIHSLYCEKCDEEMRLLEEITKAKLDVQQLKLRLAACGVQDASLVPKQLRCGGHSEDAATMEIHNFIKWLAECCPFKDPAIFDVGSFVQVGPHSAFLGRMVSWPLSEPGGLKLNVPQSLEAEIKTLLGRMNRGLLAQSELQHFSKTWEMIGAEVAGEGSTRPAIFLINRKTDDTVVVAAWPSIQPVVKAVFDPDEYFKSLSCEVTEIALPREDCRISDELNTKISRNTVPSGSHMAFPPLPTMKGDRVELRPNQEGRPLTKSRSTGHLQQ